MHPAPEQLAAAEPDRPGHSRFDDPDGRVAVRYSATRLIACLLETMSRFRRHPGAEAALDQIAGVELGEVKWPADDVQALANWLDVQRVGTVRVLVPGFYVDVESPLFSHSSTNILGCDAVEKLDPAAHLDIALVSLGGIKLSRPISQAIGVAVREWIPDALGVGYRSRFATDEPCRATWEGTRVGFESVPLNPREPQHRDVVRSVAATFELTLPVPWQ